MGNKPQACKKPHTTIRFLGFHDIIHEEIVPLSKRKIDVLYDTKVEKGYNVGWDIFEFGR